MRKERSDLQKRWIEAMCRITCALISDGGISQSQAELICREFYRRPPARGRGHVGLVLKVKSLEAKAAQGPPIPAELRARLEGEDTKVPEESVPAPQAAPPVRKAPVPVRKAPVAPTVPHKPVYKPGPMPRESPVDRPGYPEPWCRVSKDGKLVRYEDSTGCAIPEALWPK